MGGPLCEGHSLSGSENPETERVMKRTWGSVPCRTGVSLMRPGEPQLQERPLQAGDTRAVGDHHRHRQMQKGVGLNLIWDELCVLGMTEAKKGSCPSPLEPTRTKISDTEPQDFWSYTAGFWFSLTVIVFWFFFSFPFLFLPDRVSLHSPSSFCRPG